MSVPKKKEYYKVYVGAHKFCVDKRYQNLELIGDGSYGLVASAVDTISGRTVAIKKIRDTFLDVVDAKRILRELKLLRHFKNCKNIVSIEDIMVYPPNNPVFDDIYIVTNLFETDLEKIIKSRQGLTDRHFQFFLFQLLRALKYVHSANVLHRDLKPSNILVNANCDLAVCDFGLARGYDKEADDELTTYVVTRWYRAPELLCMFPSYGVGLDVWSVGCVFAELLTHQPFFKGDNPQHQLQEIIRKVGCPNDPTKLSFVQSPHLLRDLMACGSRQRSPFASFFPAGSAPLAIDLIEKMLQFNPEDRISVDEALQHVYLKDFRGVLPDSICPYAFDFEFERIVAGESVAAKEAVRHLMYEEMRLYRPSAPPATAPWLLSPTSRQRMEESRQIKEEYNVGASGIGPPKKVRNCATPMGMRDSNDLPRDSDSKDSMGGHEIDDDDYADAMSLAEDEKTPVAVYANNGGSSFFGGDARDRGYAVEKYFEMDEDLSPQAQSAKDSRK